MIIGRRPQHGDKRVVERHAWLPTAMTGGAVVWREGYVEEQTFVVWGGVGGFGAEWETTRTYVRRDLEAVLRG